MQRQAVLGSVNLFLWTRELTDAKEDHLTEFLASALSVDEDFRRAYVSTVLHSYGSQSGWQPVEIKAVATQQNYLDAGCIPDLVLTLADGHVIVCEHKLDSPETPGETDSLAEECAELGQLERYLELPGVHGVAYFRSWWKAPDEGVLKHPRYIHPSSGREHFLWSDLYECLERGNSLVTTWLREGFESLGFTPPHPSIGELEHPDQAVREQSRHNLKKLWNVARTKLSHMGWKVETGATCQLYLRNNADSDAELIYVSPCEPGGRMLLVRINPRDPNKVGDIGALLRSKLPAVAVPLQIKRANVSRVGGTRTVIDVKVPFNELLDGTAGVQEIENKLSDHVCAIAELLQTKPQPA